MSFSYSVKSKKTVSEVIKQLEENLKQIGFGVLGTLDFKQIFQSKGLDFDKEYKLLEICNPVAAKTVLDSNPEVGLMLPCTIAVYKDKDETTISLAKPTSILSVVSDSSLSEIGKEIEEKLIDALEKAK